LLKSKIHKLFEENLVKACHKFDKFKYRQAILSEGCVTTRKLDIYKPIEKELPRVDFDELLCTHLSDNELRQVSEDINYFIRNKAIKERITIFNTPANDLDIVDEHISKVRSSKINLEAVE
jgi:hypothetical protein